MMLRGIAAVHQIQWIAKDALAENSSVVRCVREWESKPVFSPVAAGSRSQPESEAGQEMLLGSQLL